VTNVYWDDRFVAETAKEILASIVAKHGLPDKLSDVVSQDYVAPAVLLAEALADALNDKEHIHDIYAKEESEYRFTLDRWRSDTGCYREDSD
jgi:hypothetical protein